MTLEIGPNQTALSSSANQTSPTSNAQALEKGTLRITVESAGGEPATTNTVSPVQAEERQTTGILFNASSSLSEKENASQSLLNTIEDLQSRSEEIESETNPTRRQALIDESEAIRAQAEADFAAAAEENPGITENETVTAVITPGESPESGQTTFTAVVPGTSTPEEAGLSGVDFSDASAAQDSLAAAEATVRQNLSSFESAKTGISSAVRDRGQAIAAESTADSRVDADARSDELAREVAASASSITEASAVEQLDVQSLIIEEEVVEEEIEEVVVEQEDAAEIDSQDDSKNQTSVDSTNKDTATQGNKLVQA